MDQCRNTVGLKFYLDELVTELAAHGTCRGEFVARETSRRELATRGTREVKNILLSYPSIHISSLKFHAQIEMNVILFIIKIVINVY